MGDQDFARTRHTDVSSTSICEWLADKQVPPLSVNRCRLIPLPDSRTSNAPVLSNWMLRGLVNPPATSCACHPEATTGAPCFGIRMLEQASCATAAVA